MVVAEWKVKKLWPWKTIKPQVKTIGSEKHMGSVNSAKFITVT